jgi:hypothetical protein
VPRDRQASFDPQLIAKYQRRFPGFDDKIISMYARGMSTREIVGHLRELYGIEVSPDLISAVTDAVLEEVAAWQARPLEAVYPLVFFDALRVKIRDEGLVRYRAVHIALGVRADGTKEILGLWLEQNEGAKFWLRVMNELKNRGVEDVLVSVVDGLKGFPEAITAVFPQATVQTCIVHLLRHSLGFVAYFDDVGRPFRLKSAGVAERPLDGCDFSIGSWMGSSVGDFRRVLLAQVRKLSPLSCRLQAVRVVNDPVEDGIGESGLADQVVPAVDRDLAGDQGGAAAIAILDDFQHVVALLGPERLEAQVARPHVRLRAGRPVSQYAGSEGCAGLAGAEPHA